ncbi:MAG: hypothetical protein Q9224_002796 [Gallowayella concinna]
MSIFQRNPLHAHHFSGDQTPLEPMHQGCDGGFAKWPPVATEINILGYVQSTEQPFYSHDIGRTFTLNGRIYKMNGDTFCNDAGVSSNTYQIIPNRKKPTEAFFISAKRDGYVNPLIDVNDEEVQYLRLPQNKNKRMAFWCFGGVVEFSPGLGWAWYQKTIISMHNGSQELIGVGLARISCDADRLSGELSSVRMPGLMFLIGEPLFGSFSALLHDDTVYLWGQKDNDVFLARVPKSNCHQRQLYQFWNGREYTSDMTAAASVLQDYQQGQFFRSNMFGPRFPWVFVGCTRYADNQVMMGAASTLEGPWDPHSLFQAECIKQRYGYQYCMYAHVWANDLSKPKLLLSWCDPWPGGVIAAKVHFATEASFYWVDIPLYRPSGRFYNISVGE